MGKSKLHALAARWRAGVDEYDRWLYVRRARDRMPWAILLRLTAISWVCGWLAVARLVGVLLGKEDLAAMRARCRQDAAKYLDAEMRLYARLPPDDRRGKLMREALFWVAQGETPDVATAKEMLAYCWAYGIGGPCRERAAAWWFVRAGERG